MAPWPPATQTGVWASDFLLRSLGFRDLVFKFFGVREPFLWFKLFFVFGVYSGCSCKGCYQTKFLEALGFRLSVEVEVPRGPSIIMVYTYRYFWGLSIYHNDTWTLWGFCVGSTGVAVIEPSFFQWHYSALSMLHSSAYGIMRAVVVVLST